ncbi:MAG: SGNH/GDSL hydrolase family protein [Isosphaeraceae bacterium]|nr:SGNH/GDSL hydrolase family protein [Isosphaeraceae bacterium]
MIVFRRAHRLHPGSNSRNRPRWVPGRQEPSPRQQRLPFLERSLVLERFFKQSIAGFTLLAVFTAVVASPVGRYNAQRFFLQARSTLVRAVGLPADRWAIDTDWRVRRSYGIERTRRTYQQAYAQVTPQTRRLLDYAGLSPQDAVLRWGNYNQTFVLPSRVFAPDDDGRSYRMRPHTRSIWLKDVALSWDVIGFFLVPDTAELRSLLEGTGAYAVQGSTQTTNSWGCRGPEPDLSAPLRGLILGDSNMQGLLVSDDETPPECLRRELESRLNTRVSMLNTGHLGYSPEQFFHALLEYGDRFRPQFVVFSFCANDFGSVFKPNPNSFDLEEGKFWVGKIFEYCRARGIAVIAAPVPHEEPITRARREGNYPGKVCDILPIESLWYCNPFDDFADEQARLDLEHLRHGAPAKTSPLFNGRLHDNHMSAAGTALWGKAVGRRLAPLLESERLKGHIRF